MFFSLTMMDPSIPHHPYGSLNSDHITTTTTTGATTALVSALTIDSTTTNHSQFSPLAVIDQLQASLRYENERRLELEKELTILRKRCRDLEQSIFGKEEKLVHGTSLNQAYLLSIKSKLLRTLKNVSGFNSSTNTTITATPSAAAILQKNSANQGADLDVIEIEMPRRIQFDHRCDECSFHSKSDVSLILHKMNHSIVEQQYVLSTTSFTTRNSNSKNVYICPACDQGINLTRHEVYRHI